jgi:hypothetical protein
MTRFSLGGCGSSRLALQWQGHISGCGSLHLLMAVDWPVGFQDLPGGRSKKPVRLRGMSSSMSR